MSVLLEVFLLSNSPLVGLFLLSRLSRGLLSLPDLSCSTVTPTVLRGLILVCRRCVRVVEAVSLNRVEEVPDDSGNGETSPSSRSDAFHASSGFTQPGNDGQVGTGRPRVWLKAESVHNRTYRW